MKVIREKSVEIKSRLIYGAVVLAIASFACQNIPFLEPTETPTATVPPTPLPDRLVEENKDGTHRLVDTRFGYSFTLPEKWFVVDLTRDIEQQFAELTEEIGAGNDFFIDRNNEVLRFTALDFSAEATNPEFTTHLGVLAFEEAFSASIDLETVVDLNIQQLQNENEEVRILDSGTLENQEGVPIGFIELSPAASQYPTVNATVYTKLVFVQLPDVGIVFINYSTASEQYAELFEELDSMINSIILNGDS